MLGEIAVLTFLQDHIPSLQSTILQIKTLLLVSVEIKYKLVNQQCLDQF